MSGEKKTSFPGRVRFTCSLGLGPHKCERAAECGRCVGSRYPSCREPHRLTPARATQTGEMHAIHSRILAVACALPLAIGAALGAAAGLTPVANANPKAVGVAAPNVLSPELAEKIVVQARSHWRIRPDNSLTTATTTMARCCLRWAATSRPPRPSRTRTLTWCLPHLSGPDDAYDYGRRFLFQGHENSKDGNSYITRVNLDADFEHRVTLLASTDTDNNPLP